LAKQKVLVVTYYWPPSAGSGVQRWLKFAKYLDHFGWEPHIYTPKNPDFDLQDPSLLQDVRATTIVVKNNIWEPYALAKKLSGDKKINVGVVGDGPKKASSVKKIMNWVRGNFFIPDPRVFWRKPSVRFLKKYLKENGITHIITTGPPHSMHLIGLDLKKSLDLKWIVDIRDPWSKLDFLDTFYISKRNRKKYESMERQVMDACDHVIGTSPSMKDQILLQDQNKFTCITNGFDLEDFQNASEKDSNSKIVLYHAGLLNKIRNPERLWHSLNKLCEQDNELNDQLQIQLAGVIDPLVVEHIKQYDHLKNRLIVEGYKSHSDVLLDYSKADILLLLINNTENAKVNIPGKLFEYIASGKKVLSVSAGDSDAAKLIYEEELGINITYDQEIDLVVLDKFIKSEQKIETSQQERFSRKTLTSKLVKILEAL
jgi:hypothetical protein